MVRIWVMGAPAGCVTIESVAVVGPPDELVVPLVDAVDEEDVPELLDVDVPAVDALPVVPALVVPPSSWLNGMHTPASGPTQA
jgi:hypothetical protein